MHDGNLFSALGESLVENGYEPVLIARGDKRPLLDDWTAITATKDTVRAWAKSHPRANIGLQTRWTPAIDIDIYDAEVAAEMEEWCLDNLGDALVRVGQAPKRLLLFRTNEPFRKLKTTYVDGAGKAHAVEVLGEGQQFVAFGIHPDTKKPFEWVSINNPSEVSARDLPTLSHAMAQEVLAAFAEIAERHGWKPKKKGSTALTTRASDDDDDALLGAAGKTDLDDEDVQDALNLIDVDGLDYDAWLQVGMALHHQYDGGDRGLELWDEWSSNSIHYDYDEMKSKWPGFSVTRAGGKPVTFATVLKMAKEASREKSKDEFEKLRNVISSCNDVHELFDSVVPKIAKDVTRDYQLETLAQALQKRAFDIDGVKRSLESVRKEIKRAMRNGAKAVVGEMVPDWLQGWVWLENADKFYNYITHSELSIRSFNSRYDREMLTPDDKALGRAIPETRAADFAVTICDITKVKSPIYLPGRDSLVWMGDDVFVNVYDGRSVPEIEPAKTADQRRALNLVLSHFETLFPNQRERELLMSFLAYQVQQPTERVNWAVLVQGVEGAGKTWFQHLMAAVLGRRNVGPVNAKSLFSDFNGWAEGRKMIFVEEIRLHGHTRHEVLENIKTNITNSEIEITRKGRDPYTTPNVASYMMFSNYDDALPVGRNDRRYFILKTVFQSAVQLARFLRARPGYFDDLFAATADHPGVLRGWLMDYKPHPDFTPTGRAPGTFAKDEMREINMSDDQLSITDAIADSGRIDCSEYLVNTSTLRAVLEEMDTFLPKTSALRMFLSQSGFAYLGRFRINGKQDRFWTARPDLFPSNDLLDRTNRIMRLLDGEEPEFL